MCGKKEDGKKGIKRLYREKTYGKDDGDWDQQTMCTFFLRNSFHFYGLKCLTIYIYVKEEKYKPTK